MTQRKSVVIRRSSAVLEYLERAGPSVLTRIALALMLAAHLVRYALVTLRDEGKAYIDKFVRTMGDDGIPRHIAVFAAGQGTDAVLPYRGEEGLDFFTGAHLNDLIERWTSERALQIVELD